MPLTSVVVVAIAAPSGMLFLLPSLYNLTVKPLIPGSFASLTPLLLKS